MPEGDLKCDWMFLQAFRLIGNHVGSISIGSEGFGVGSRGVGASEGGFGAFFSVKKFRLLPEFRGFLAFSGVVSLEVDGMAGGGGGSSFLFFSGTWGGEVELFVSGFRLRFFSLDRHALDIA